jgi:Family of unknown function (DUF5906)
VSQQMGGKEDGASSASAEPRAIRKTKKPTKALLQHIAANLLAGKASEPFLYLTFPFRVAIVRDSDDSTPSIYLVGRERIAKPIAPERLASLLSQWTVETFGAGLEDYHLDFKISNEAVRLYANSRAATERFPAIVYKSDQRIAYHRLAYDPLADITSDNIATAAPIFASILQRIEQNSRAFVLRVGSMFDSTATRKQALWLHGDADAGKSQIQWLIQELIGQPGVVNLSSQSLKTPYWLASCVGKRVAMISEASSYFINTEQFKAVTGDDWHDINRKYRDLKQERIDTIFCFFSNHKPVIPPAPEFRNRIIDCKIGALAPRDRINEHDLRRRLLDELPAIAGFCVGEWQKSENRTKIDTITEKLDEYYQLSQGDILDTLDEKFEITGNENDWILMSQVRNDIKMLAHYVDETRLQRILREAGCTVSRRRWGTRRIYVVMGMKQRAHGQRIIGRGEEIV